MLNDEISNRHRGDLGGRLSRDNLPAKVIVVLDDWVASNETIQHLTWMLVNLLARQTDEVVSLEIRVSNAVPVMDRLGPLVPEGIGLRDALLTGIRRINPRVLTSSDNTVSTVSVRVGPGKLVEADYSIATTSTGWCGFVGQVPVTEISQDLNPIGAYIAASLSAAEVFKYIRSITPENVSLVDKLWFDAYRLELADQPLPGPKLPDRAILRSAVVAGAGAVANTFLHLLYGLSGYSVKLAVVDGDEKGIEGPNLNRYTLVGHAHVGRSKASLVAELFARTGFSIQPIDEWWQAWRNRDRSYPLDLVISAVDTNKARHAIQDELPGLILGASTNDMRAQLNLYDIYRGGPCLRCRNPLEKATPDEQIINLLRQLSSVERIERATDLGINPDDLETFLSNPAKHCGVISGETLQRFNPNQDGQTGEWSVGFVSALAGTLLAAEYLKLSLFGQTALDVHTNQFRFQLWHPANPRVNRKVSVKPEDTCLCQLPVFKRALQERMLV